MRRYAGGLTFLRPFVDQTSTDVIQGTLDMLILKTLSLEPMHGYGIARRVEQLSRDAFRINPGSLLTALQRLERAGALDAEWRESEQGRRVRIYSLTRTGRRQLDAATADWKRRVSAVARLLNAEG
jgi:transcriptional regulator